MNLLRHCALRHYVAARYALLRTTTNDDGNDYNDSRNHSDGDNNDVGSHGNTDIDDDYVFYYWLSSS